MVTRQQYSGEPWTFSDPPNPYAGGMAPRAEIAADPDAHKLRESQRQIQQVRTRKRWFDELAGTGSLIRDSLNNGPYGPTEAELASMCRR